MKRTLVVRFGKDPDWPRKMSLVCVCVSGVPKLMPVNLTFLNG